MTVHRSGSGSTRAIRLFVDAIDEGSARVLVDDQILTVPVALLPPAVREGDWVEMTVGVIEPPPSDADERRRRLAKDDPGGPLKL